MSNQQTDNAGNIIDELRSELVPMLSENGVTFDRLRSTFLIAVQQYPDILKCTPESLRREISKCAADGLMPDGKEAVLLPYLEKDRVTQQKHYVANYQPMVYGIIKRMRELGDVFQIVCSIVYDKDEFILDAADPDTLSHKADPFAKERGEIVGAYVVFRDHQKRVLHLETMDRAQLDQVRATSKAPDSPAWSKWETEMFRKAVLRRGSKYISINNDKIRRLIERQDELFDFQQQNRSRSIERSNPFAIAALSDNSQQAMDPIGADRGELIDVGSAAAASGGSTSRQAEAVKPAVNTDKKAELADKPDDLPELLIPPKDTALLTEAASKILGVAMDEGRDARDRRANLKQVAANWTDATPDYAREFLKALIGAVDWTIKRDSAGLSWSGELGIFIHSVKSTLDIEKLVLAKYPAPSKPEAE